LKKKLKKNIPQNIPWNIPGNIPFAQPITGCHVAGPKDATWPPDDISKHYGCIIKKNLGVQSFEPTTYGTTLKRLTVRPQERDVKGLPVKPYLNSKLLLGGKQRGPAPAYHTTRCQNRGLSP